MVSVVTIQFLKKQKRVVFCEQGERTKLLPKAEG